LLFLSRLRTTASVDQVGGSSHLKPILWGQTFTSLSALKVFTGLRQTKFGQFKLAFAPVNSSHSNGAGAPLQAACVGVLQEVAVRILLVEDHVQLAASVAQALKSAGWTVDVLHDGVAADLALSSEDYALAILDIGLPRLDGFQVLARLRERGNTLPVLMLTARGEVKDRVHGLNLGADDYLAKPFELSELEARVKALLRRTVLGGERQQRCGNLLYDLDTRRFTLADGLLTLTSREQAVLEAMIARPGRVMSKEQLAAQVFGLDEEASSDAIEIYVHRLRKKLEGGGVRIVTFRGLGYLLEALGD
jgi:two-component system response regulator TctD